jgi:hypothetical protein
MVINFQKVYVTPTAFTSLSHRPSRHTVRVRTREAPTHAAYPATRSSTSTGTSKFA